MQKNVAVIMNAGAGSHSEDMRHEAARLFAEKQISAKFYVAERSANVSEIAKIASNSDAEIIVAGGGDGTVSSVAAEVLRARKALAILPLGTLNNFSKDLGIPQDLGAAINVIAQGYCAEFDIGEVNGRHFLNNSSIGLYPRIVRHRERQQRLGYGKWRSAAWAAFRALRLSPFLKVRLEIDGREFYRKTPFVFVGNNAYEMDIYNIGRRATVQDGKLSVHLLRRGGRMAVVKLVLRTFLGRLKQTKDFEEFQTTRLEIATKRPRVLVAMDGEIDVFNSPLCYRTVPRALTVIVPRGED